MFSFNPVLKSLFVVAIVLDAGVALAQTERVSISSQTPDSQFVAIRTSSDTTTDGRFVVFSSTVNGLVAGDNDNASDIFVRDRLNGTTERLLANVGGQSVSTRGFTPSISGDGRFVAFVSGATNLVPGDTNGLNDVFVLDRTTAGVTRVSVSSTGGQSSLTGVSSPLSLFAPGVFSPTLSADGRYVAFYSPLTGLVPGDTNGVYDVFLHDRVTKATRRVSVSSAGLQGDSSTTLSNQGSRNPALSANGRFMAFTSDASNLVPGDTNSLDDVFWRDNLTGEVKRITTVGNTSVGKLDISADGRYVTYYSSAGGGLLVYDNQTQLTSPIATGGVDPAISADGRYVTFSANNQVLVNDRQTGVTSTVSVSNAGVVGNGLSVLPSISADGTVVVFDSSATNLVNDGVVAVRSLFANLRGAVPSTIPVVGTFDLPPISGPVNLLQLVGSQSAPNVRRGGTISFTFQVTNVSASTVASQVTLSAVLPSQVELSSIAVTQTSNTADRCTSSLTPVCQLSTLNPGETKKVTITTRARTAVTNATVSASVNSSTPDAVTTDNAASLNFQILQ